MRTVITRTAAWALALGMMAARAWCQVDAPLPVPAPAAPASAAPTSAVPVPIKFVPRVATHISAEHGRVFAVLTVNEAEVATIRTVAGGLTPAQRAQVTAARLTELLQGGLTPAELVAKPTIKPLWDVEAHGGTLLLATPQEANAHGGMTPEALARQWVKALRRRIGQPPLSLSCGSLVVPLGETRTIRVGGAALATDIQAVSDSAAVSTISFDPVTRLLTVQGRTPGRNAIAVQWAPGKGDVFLTLPVAVMKYAGRVVPSITVQVTGRPAAPADILGQAAYAGMTRAISLEDGAQAALSPPPRFTAPLTVGEQTTALFPLRLSGPGLLPVAACAAVNIVNASVTPRPPTSLLYSNNPEQIKHSQALYTGSLRQGATARLDYHHQNVSGGLLMFHVELHNDSDRSASVQVIAGLSLPGVDTVQVGRRAGAAFLRNLNGDFGLVLPVPPHGSVSLVTQRFAPGLTVSGIIHLQSLSGGPLTVSVSAGDDTNTLSAPLARLFLAGTGGSALAAPSGETSPADTEPYSPYVFASPHVTLTGRYVVDQRWMFVPLGNTDALRDASGKLKLYGNYGADYDVTLTLTNPTADTRQVGVYFAPGAGLAAGVFQVDSGPILEYDPFEPPDERELERVTLAPGETRVTRLHTIPLNGSSYPAALVARALAKRPAPPVPMAPPAPLLPTPVTAPAPTPVVAFTAPPSGKAGH